MFPLECLIQLLWCSCLLTSVSVYVCMCFDMFVHTCIWTGDLVMKLLSNLSTILVTVHCLFAVSAFQYSHLRRCTHMIAFYCSVQVCLFAQKFACWTLCECMLFLLIFHQRVREASLLVKLWVIELICLKYYLSLILRYFTYSPSIQARSEIIVYKSSICDLTQIFKFSYTSVKSNEKSNLTGYPQLEILDHANLRC